MVRFTFDMKEYLPTNMLRFFLLQALSACAFSHSRYDKALLQGPLHHELPMRRQAPQDPNGALSHGLPLHLQAPPGGIDPLPPAAKPEEVVRHPKHHKHKARHAEKAHNAHHEHHENATKHSAEKAALSPKHHKKGDHHAKQPKEGADHAKVHGQASHHHAPDDESLSLAYLLIGGVGALMVVFHFASCRSLEIKLATWRVLNMTLSIFVAVLLYGTLKEFIVHTFEPSHRAMVVTTLAIFVIFFVGSHVVLFKLKGGDPTQLQAWGTILAHMCGFAAMYSFADLQILHSLEVGFWGYFLMVGAAAVIIGALSYASDRAMKRVASADGTMDEDELKWIETCEEADDDIFCLAVSFLIVLFFRYAIMRHPQAYEAGRADHVTQSNANRLLACSVGFALLVLLGAIAMKKVQSRIRTPRARRFANIVQHLNSMIMAWSFLFWAEWQLYVSGWKETVIGGCLVISIFMTMYGFLCVFFLNFVEHHFRANKSLQRAMTSLELALGVLIGFSWERAFDVGFEEIYLKFEGQSGGSVIVALMSLALIAVVGPAWRYHILPKVEMLESVAKELRDADAEKNRKAFP